MSTVSPDLDVVVVGAGFGGVHMLYEARQRGLNAILVEAASDVGGAWYWNRYPGARCDVESLVYSYSFAPELDAEWRWTEKYAGQKEIQSYLRWVSERLDLRAWMRFNTKVESAAFDEASDSWLLRCDTGQTFRTRYCVMATGPITVPVLPDIPGIEQFKGELIHTARWPQHDPAFEGKRVGVIGTGSSGTQLIPVVASEAARLTVFLRTPNFTVPARNGPLDDDRYEEWTRRREEIRAAMWRGEIAGVGDVDMPLDMRLTRTRKAEEFSPEERQEILTRRWECGGAVLQGSFKDVMTDQKVNDEVAEFVRDRIREMVKDPVKADLLTPRGYALGTKRLCVGTDYYETFNRDNVDIVDVKATPIVAMDAAGAVLEDGRHIDLDILVFATGFDALTGALTEMDVVGEGGLSIRDAWADGPYTYLGLAVTGFPNMFLVGGPGSPSVFSNVVMTNEYQVNLIMDLLSAMTKSGESRVSVAHQDQEKWTAKVNDIVKHTLMVKAKSWYVGANVPGKPRVILAFLGGVPAYREICDEVWHDGFRGFVRQKADRAAA